MILRPLIYHISFEKSKLKNKLAFFGKSADILSSEKNIVKLRSELDKDNLRTYPAEDREFKQQTM